MSTPSPAPLARLIARVVLGLGLGLGLGGCAPAQPDSRVATVTAAPFPSGSTPPAAGPAGALTTALDFHGYWLNSFRWRSTTAFRGEFTDDCTACLALADAVDGWLARGWTLDYPAEDEITLFTPTGPLTVDGATVTVDGILETKPYLLRDAAGRVAERLPAGERRYRFTLVAQDDRYRVRALTELP